ncbi:MAG: hypothetical protein HYX67_15680 [Candidatus Melainabacteria bacterium]|nr:hypothetical protein [Candidatus Melainabacteria bacterium]
MFAFKFFPEFTLYETFCSIKFFEISFRRYQMAATVPPQTFAPKNHYGALSIDDQHDYAPYETFCKKVDRSTITTEKGSDKTTNLSLTMQQDILAGLKQLHDVDATVLEGYDQFQQAMMKHWVDFQTCLENGGRIIFVGSGSSGRLGERLAAKFADAFSERADQFVGHVAGGKSAMFRAKEKFEDSDANGAKFIEELKVGPDDTVVLTSASASAKFNTGAGHAAANNGAKVFYFTNNSRPPANANVLFTRVVNPAVHLCVDIGGPAIGGSTRLTPATVGEACLGAVVGCALLDSVKRPNEAIRLTSQIAEGLKTVHKEIEKNLPALKEIVELQNKIYTAEDSDLWRVKDETGKGYITLVATENAAHEGVIDYVELGPTFGVAPVRRGFNKDTRRPAFQPYVAAIAKPDENDDPSVIKFAKHTETINKFLGKMSEEDRDDAMEFSLSVADADGPNSFLQRPMGKGNMLFGISKIKAGQALPKELMQVLEAAKDTSIATLFVCEGVLSEEQKTTLRKLGPSVFLENIPQDPYGLLESIALKEALNLISNSTMVLAGNVLGNHMINFRFSNDKLVQRGIDTVSFLWEKEKKTPLDKKVLYELFMENEMKIKALSEKGIQSPPNILITYTMLEQNRRSEDFDLIVNQMNLDRKKNISFSKFEK